MTLVCGLPWSKRLIWVLIKLVECSLKVGASRPPRRSFDLSLPSRLCNPSLWTLFRLHQHHQQEGMNGVLEQKPVCWIQPAKPTVSAAWHNLEPFWFKRFEKTWICRIGKVEWSKGDKNSFSVGSFSEKFQSGSFSTFKGNMVIVSAWWKSKQKPVWRMGLHLEAGQTPVSQLWIRTQINWSWNKKPRIGGSSLSEGGRPSIGRSFGEWGSVTW